MPQSIFNITLDNPDQGLRDIGDIPATRDAIHQNVLRTFQEFPEISNAQHILKLTDVGFEGPEHFSKKEEKQAILEGKTLSRRVRGTWNLIDAVSGQTVDKHKSTLANVPYLTDRGAYILRGNDYTMKKQMRLRPGIFVRQKDSGELEAHCFYRTTKIWTEHGLIPIGDIVKKRMEIRVWSYDFETRQFALKPIIGWYKNKVSQDRKIGKTKFFAPGRMTSCFGAHYPSPLWSTPDHNVLKEDGTKISVSDTDSVLMVEEQLSSTQLQLLYGSLFGDGYIAPNGIYQEAHSLNQLEYLQYKAKILAPFVKPPGVAIRKKNSRGQIACWLYTKSCSCLRRLRKLSYPDGVKQVSREWLDKLDERGLAFWFCDDGSALRSSNSTHSSTTHLVVNLATHSFTTAGVDLIILWLRERWGINSKRNRQEYMYAGKDMGWYVLINGEDAERFLDIIAPYIHPTLAYKLGPRPPTGNCVICNKEIDRRRRLCNSCCVVQCRLGDEKAVKVAAYRFHACKTQVLKDSFITPPDPVNLGARWDLRQNNVSTKINYMLQDTAVGLGLVSVPCKFRSEPQSPRSKSKYAFDIEVAGTHNYFADDVLVSNCNVAKGFGHRYFLDPATGIFRAQFAQSMIPLMPILKLLGTSDTQLREAWGNDIYAANATQKEDAAVGKLMRKISKGTSTKTPAEQAKAAFDMMELDPEVTKRTLGVPHKKVTTDAILDATKKLIAVHKGEADTDDRDAMAFQRVVGPEDIFPERIAKGMGEARKILWKSTMKGNLKHIVPGTFDKAIKGALLDTGLGSALEEVNPLEVLDQWHSVTRTGEGGIENPESIAESTRAVQPTHTGFIDGIQTPESNSIGVDGRIAVGVKKGRDGKLYAKYHDKNGRAVWKSPQDVAEKVVAFPGQMATNEPFVQALVGDKAQYVPREKVDYELSHYTNSFGPMANMVVMKSASFPQRGSMGSRMLTQSLPIANAEAPLVQAGIPGTSRSFEEKYGEFAGAVRSKVSGTVTSITPDEIKVKDAEGKSHTFELDNYRPYNRKCFVHNTPSVTVGQQVGNGDLLAKSNFTDDKGTVAVGLNPRVAFTSWRGKNYEDAIVVSDAFAKRAKSVHMYQHSLEADANTKPSKNAFVSIFPTKYDKEILKKYDSDGVILPGQSVDTDDPLILAVKQRQVGPKLGRRAYSWADASVTWDHHDQGLVTDVHKGRDGIHVIVKAEVPTQVGDKLSGRIGNKGVISELIPEDQMPRDKDGKPFEVLLNPLGLISRGNSSQAIEMALGKIADLTGKPYKITDFDKIANLQQFAADELKRHGLSATEDLYDPSTGKKIPGVLTGKLFMMKLHHTSESKAAGRSTEGYTAEESPARGGSTGAKKIGTLESYALLSHGAFHNLSDAKTVRGQENQDYWRVVMSGNTPPEPRIPMVHRKFFNMLKAAGINAVQQGTKTDIYALTNKDIDKLVGDREIKNSNTVDWRTDRLSSIPGGFFDPATTGGHQAEGRWAYIKLHEPMVSPLMEEPVRRLLGLTEAKFRNVLAGKELLSNDSTTGQKTGPNAIVDALADIDVDKEISRCRTEIVSGRKSARDSAIRRMRYLVSAKELGQQPKDWVWSKVPVIPPLFRPVSLMQQTGAPLVADPNVLYKELFEANQALKDLSGKVSDVGNERLATYDALKAVTGLGDPIRPQSKQQNVQGLLASIFSSGPKFGMLQRKLIGSTVDLVGRAVVVPDPGLDMDHIGIPEDKAWAVYRPFVVRRLVRRGMGKLQAVDQVQKRSKAATEALSVEMDERPVLMNRAPTLHRFGIQAFRPVIVHDSSIHSSPAINAGLNLDHDGDQANFHVPASDAAVKEAYERMLPSHNLIAPSTFSVHQVPTMEYQGGLHMATSRKNAKKPVAVFRTKKDAIEAYHRGEVAADQSVKILET